MKGNWLWGRLTWRREAGVYLRLGTQSSSSSQTGSSCDARPARALLRSHGLSRNLCSHAGQDNVCLTSSGSFHGSERIVHAAGRQFEFDSNL